LFAGLFAFIPFFIFVHKDLFKPVAQNCCRK
jgi:hypothetical protein